MKYVALVSQIPNIRRYVPRSHALKLMANNEIIDNKWFAPEYVTNSATETVWMLPSGRCKEAGQL